MFAPYRGVFAVITAMSPVSWDGTETGATRPWRGAARDSGLRRVPRSFYA